MDTYLRSKYLIKLSQHQKLIKSRINPEKYWGFIEHLKKYLNITSLDIELRKIKFNSKNIYKINLEIYFEKNNNITFNNLNKIFQTYFYEYHDVIYGQDYLFITLNDEKLNDFFNNN